MNENIKKFYKKQNEELRERSGNINCTSSLVGFIYTLLRDHLPAADVEKLVRDSIIESNCNYSNGYLANYAVDIAERLINNKIIKNSFIKIEDCDEISIAFINKYLKKFDHLQVPEKEFIIWQEGFNCSDGHGQACIWNKGSGKTFEHAILKILKDIEELTLYRIKDGKFCCWGCDFYDNEKDARETFG